MDDEAPVGHTLAGLRADVRSVRWALAKARERLDLIDVDTFKELRAAARDLRVLIHRIEALEKFQAARQAQHQKIMMVILGAIMVPIIAGAITVIQLTGG